MQGEDGQNETKNPAAASAQALLSLYLLLLAFFILLQSISTFEDQRAGEVMEGVNRSFPSFLKSGTVGGDRMTSGGLTEGAEASARLGPLFESQFTLSPTARMTPADSFRATVPLAELFEGPSEGLNPQIAPFLDQLADILQRPPAGARIELELLIPEKPAAIGASGNAETPTMRRLANLVQALVQAGAPASVLSIGYGLGNGNGNGDGQKMSFLFHVRSSASTAVTFGPESR
ncbi:hypothetical protein [Oceanibaculum indicum]|uniref:Motility protein B-like N-terminal domain-containing protein n=1 Tax=Oceanibaculum indicum TaxID=526216 RepID=A0A420WNU2_9PROT|nr:hypothetical protein [Oceanibaculum indicum]RKQ72697.1 hypothetical protein BCL74_0465 [Oceanibaculum indicum]